MGFRGLERQYKDCPEGVILPNRALSFKDCKGNTMPIKAPCLWGMEGHVPNLV